jgi:hypothetical protein
LRFLLIESAHAVVRYDPDWRRFLHLAMRRGRPIAKVAMARRLARCDCSGATVLDVAQGMGLSANFEVRFATFGMGHRCACTALFYSTDI